MKPAPPVTRILIRPEVQPRRTRSARKFFIWRGQKSRPSPRRMAFTLRICTLKCVNSKSCSSDGGYREDANGWMDPSAFVEAHRVAPEHHVGRLRGSIARSATRSEVDRPLRRTMLVNAASPPIVSIELATGRVRPLADKALFDPPRLRAHPLSTT